MLGRLFSGPVARGGAQAAVAALLAIAVVLLARRQGVGLERESTIALARGLVQILTVGAVFSLVLGAPLGAAVVMLAVMLVCAAAIAAGRVRGVPGAFPTALRGSAPAPGVVILAW